MSMWASNFDWFSSPTKQNVLVSSFDSVTLKSLSRSLSRENFLSMNESTGSASSTSFGSSSMPSLLRTSDTRSFAFLLSEKKSLDALSLPLFIFSPFFNNAKK